MWVFLILSIIPSFSAISSARSSGEIVYVAADGSGDFNCDGIDDQIEINKALAYVAENPEYKNVYLRGPGTYVISDSIFIGSNTVFEGDSTAVIKLRDKAHWREEKPLITQIDGAWAHDIIIRGFEIDGNHGKNGDRDRGKGYYNLIYFGSCPYIIDLFLYIIESIFIRGIGITSEIDFSQFFLLEQRLS